MSTAAYYDQQYNARASISDAAQIMQHWSARAGQARKALPGVLDLKYGDSPEETVDLFWCLKPDAPLLFFIHGGYWRALHKNDFSWIAEPYLKQGINVAVVNYDLVPKISLETLVMQICKSLAWLHDHAEELDFNRDKILVAGHSAGGHLTAMMMCTRWPEFRADLPQNLVKAGIAISGLFDLDPISKAPFLNADLKLDQRRTLAMSPTSMQPSHKMSMILCVGALESEEFHRQSAQLTQLWDSHTNIQQVKAPNHNHLTVCNAFSDPSHTLFKETVALVLES